MILNAFPYTNGHVMVAPYEHVADLRELERARPRPSSWQLTQRSIGAVAGVYGPEGFNLGVNQGDVAGAGFADHVHQHVVPRWEGDTNFMPVVGDTLGAAGGAARLASARLRDAFAGGARMTAVDPRHLQGLRRPWHSTPSRSTRTSPTASGRGFARVLRDLRDAGRRARPPRRGGPRHAPPLPRARRGVRRGLTDEGCDVLDIGMVGHRDGLLRGRLARVRRRRVRHRLAQPESVGRLQAPPRGRARRSRATRGIPDVQPLVEPRTTSPAPTGTGTIERGRHLRGVPALRARLHRRPTRSGR